MEAVAAAAVLITAVAVIGAYLAARRARRAERENEALRRDLLAERHAARHDPLTGLLNRRGFYHHGVAAVAEPDRVDLAVLLLDLDNFKQVNDLLGHAAGDEVLGVVARRFAGCAEGNLVARLGGDEFASLLTVPNGDHGWLDRLTRRLAETVAMPISIGDHTVTVSASIGFAPVRGSDMAHFAEALRASDRDMYHVKSTGRERARHRLLHPAPASHGVTSHHVARSSRAFPLETVTVHHGTTPAGNHTHRR